MDKIPDNLSVAVVVLGTSSKDPTVISRKFIERLNLAEATAKKLNAPVYVTGTSLEMDQAKAKLSNTDLQLFFSNPCYHTADNVLSIKKDLTHVEKLCIVTHGSHKKRVQFFLRVHTKRERSMCEFKTFNLEDPTSWVKELRSWFRIWKYFRNTPNDRKNLKGSGVLASVLYVLTINVKKATL